MQFFQLNQIRRSELLVHAHTLYIISLHFLLYAQWFVDYGEIAMQYEVVQATNLIILDRMIINHDKVVIPTRIEWLALLFLVGIFGFIAQVSNDMFLFATLVICRDRSCSLWDYNVKLPDVEQWQFMSWKVFRLNNGPSSFSLLTMWLDCLCRTLGYRYLPHLTGASVYLGNKHNPYICNLRRCKSVMLLKKFTPYDDDYLHTQMTKQHNATTIESSRGYTEDEEGLLRDGIEGEIEWPVASSPVRMNLKALGICYVRTYHSEGTCWL